MSRHSQRRSLRATAAHRAKRSTSGRKRIRALEIARTQEAARENWVVSSRSYCSVRTARTKAMIITTTAHRIAETTRARPTTNPIAYSVPPDLVGPPPKFSVLRKPKHEPSPNKIPQTSVMRICFPVDLRGRGDSGAGDGGGAVKGSLSADIWQPLYSARTVSEVSSSAACSAR
jgi:hypothetical protein